MGKTKFYRCLKKYEIVRSQEDKSAVYSRAQNKPENKEKIRQANLKKYGAANKSQANRAIKYFKEDCFCLYDKIYTLDWFKTEYLEKNTSLKEMTRQLGISELVFYQICHHYNIKKENFQRYENIKKTFYKKYGVKTTLELPEMIQKRKETCIKKYGVDNYAKTQESKDRYIQTSLQKYGVKNVQSVHIAHKEIWESPTALKEYLTSFSPYQNISDLARFFNASDSGVTRHIHDFGLDEYVTWYYSRSSYEDEVAKYLRSLGINNLEPNNKKILPNKEIDIYLPDYHIGIEFNGDYWHSDIYHQDHGGRSTYHQEKSLEAEKKGIFLFHIFEHEWIYDSVRENIKNRLKTLLGKNDQKIAARKCTVIEITKKQKKEFLQQNHIQGNDNSIYDIGLMYQNELVACMTFAKPKSKKYNWELSRFCSKHDCIIQGGASKLFNYFINKKLKTNEVVSSYSDITKTKGDVYKKLGFTCISINKPNYVWVNFKTWDIRSRYQEKKRWRTRTYEF